MKSIFDDPAAASLFGVQSNPQSDLEALNAKVSRTAAVRLALEAHNSGIAPATSLLDSAKAIMAFINGDAQ